MQTGILLASGDNARLALQEALTKAMTLVVADEDLHRALVDSAAVASRLDAPSS
jgi:7-keto-8-aminopelargonate synthetase-like enzyme